MISEIAQQFQFVVWICAEVCALWGWGVGAKQKYTRNPNSPSTSVVPIYEIDTVPYIYS